MSGLTSADSQFQVMARYPTNWDRCRRCGCPRTLHGNDGSCRLTLSTAAGFLAAFVLTGGVLSGAVWLLVSNSDITVGSVAAFACLVALILLAVGTAVAGRRS